MGKKRLRVEHLRETALQAEKHRLLFFFFFFSGRERVKRGWRKRKEVEVVLQAAFSGGGPGPAGQAGNRN